MNNQTFLVLAMTVVTCLSSNTFAQGGRKYSTPKKLECEKKENFNVTVYPEKYVRSKKGRHSHTRREVDKDYFLQLSSKVMENGDKKITVRYCESTRPTFFLNYNCDEEYKWLSFEEIKEAKEVLYASAQGKKDYLYAYSTATFGGTSIALNFLVAGPPGVLATATIFGAAYLKNLEKRKKFAQVEKKIASYAKNSCRVEFDIQGSKEDLKALYNRYTKLLR